MFLPARYPVLWGMILLGLCFSCAAVPEPVPEGEPGASLSFDRALAGDPGRLSLFFLLKVENPRSSGALLDMGEPRVRLNGAVLNAAFLVELPPGLLRVEAASTAEFPLRLDIDLAALFPGGPLRAEAGFTEYETEFALDLSLGFDSGDRRVLPLSAALNLPRIQEPRFSITAIAVRKAELINTRFKLTLRIDNPNSFPLELSALSYELYGNGRLWADGAERNSIAIPAEGFVETDISLVMNFINMRRELLDQVIALRAVNYRFAGELTVETGIDYLPQFRMGFERSGYSEVIE